jgi:hypothetical protein
MMAPLSHSWLNYLPHSSFKLIVFFILVRRPPTFKQSTPTSRTNMKQLLWREQCMERDRKRAEQQQQQLQQQQQQQQPQQHISQLQHHLQMASSAGGGSGGYSVCQQLPPLRAESAPAVNIPGVGARIKEIPSEVLQVSTCSQIFIKDYQVFDFFYNLATYISMCWHYKYAKLVPVFSYSSQYTR